MFFRSRCVHSSSRHSSFRIASTMQPSVQWAHSHHLYGYQKVRLNCFTININSITASISSYCRVISKYFSTKTWRSIIKSHYENNIFPAHKSYSVKLSKWKVQHREAKTFCTLSCSSLQMINTESHLDRLLQSQLSSSLPFCSCCCQWDGRQRLFDEEKKRNEKNGETVEIRW